MSDQTITSLIEKLEGAEVGSRELDYAIKSWLEPIDAYWALRVPADWTTSLDAALALAERVLPGWGYYLRRDSDGSGCGLVPPGLTSVTSGHMEAATPALALCAAILRAQSEARV